MLESTALRRLAATASAAVALAFGSLAQAADAQPATSPVAHPLLAAAAGIKYRIALPRVLVAVTGNNASNDRADGFIFELEKALVEPSDKTRIVDYPPRANAELLRVIGVVPPKGMEQMPIPVCAEQHNKVLGTWNISAKGEIALADWAGSTVSATPASSACKAFILAARDSINIMQASNQPAPPAPSVSPPQIEK